ncbi:hypothetical protein HPHPP13_1056 [Helicobacter pylori Hp P-13]|uniref:Uncharacterized protein n=1 Tax=Helicobacter pylori Hp P-13b TaxID=992107 RepID=A0ABC9QRN7_HELPX|nr:hypothetical protein HPHPP13_1056 [Helicobacter pylori Hp P-13]EJC31483.1 hypothetical protein HPHPP13B_1048 [Helicobacter pylori Hp P-13b]
MVVASVMLLYFCFFSIFFHDLTPKKRDLKKARDFGDFRVGL